MVLSKHETPTVVRYGALAEQIEKIALLESSWPLAEHFVAF